MCPYTKRFEFPDGSVRGLTKGEKAGFEEVPSEGTVFGGDSLVSQRPPGSFPVQLNGRVFTPGRGYWKTGEIGFGRLKMSSRVIEGGRSLSYKRFFDDYPVYGFSNVWTDTVGQNQFGAQGKVYVVQTAERVIARCILMTTDPGDLVLDPTCGSGTTATVAEQWGRRWITVDTSRVALALARARIMGAKYPWYLLKDSEVGQKKEAEVNTLRPRDGSDLQ